MVHSEKRDCRLVPGKVGQFTEALLHLRTEAHRRQSAIQQQARHSQILPVRDVSSDATFVTLGGLSWVSVSGFSWDTLS